MGKKSKKQPQEELGEDERAAAMAALLEEEETTARKPKAKPKAKKGKKDSPSKAVEEEEVSKPAQQQQQQARGKKAKKGKGKGRGRQDDSDDDDAEVDEDLAALMQGPKGGKKGGRGGGDSDDDDQPKGRGGKKQKQKQKGRGKKQADSDDEEDAPAPAAAAADADAASDDEEDAAPVVPTMQPARGGKKAKKNKGKGRGRQDDSDDDAEVDEDLAALMQGPKGGKRGGGGGARGGGKKKAESDDEEEEDDEPAPTMQPARGGKKAKKGRGGRAAAGDSDGEEEPAAKPQAKKGKKKKADDDYMAMMLAEEPEEDEEDKHRREMEEKARKAEEEKEAAAAAEKAKKEAEEKAAQEAAEAAKREAEEAARKEAEEKAAREAAEAAQAEAAQKAEEEAAARKEAEEKAAAEEAEAEAARAKEAEANAEDEEVARRRAESERKKAERDAEKAKRKAEREKKKAKKSGGGGGGDSDDDGMGETNEEGGGLTRKERKEREKRREFEEKFGKVNADGKLRDSPYTIVMSEDQWNVEDNARDIRFDGVSIAVPGKELFKNTSLKIIAGHRYGLIGPNGWGKSTVLQLFARGELPVPKKLDVLLVEQEQEVDEDVLEETCVNVVIKSHKKRIAYMAEAEKLRESGEDLDRLQELEDELHNMGAFQAEAKARKILGGLGFPSTWQDRKVSSFSGGWRKRVALSCAVFMEPDVLLLDEPTNHLDLNAVIWLETYLPSVYNDSKKKPKSLVVVSHDVSFLEEVCSDTIHIENKKLNEYRGNYQAFLQQVQLRHNTLDKDVKLRKDYEKELSRKGLTKKEILKKVQERFAQKGYDEDDMPKKRQEYQVTFPWEKPTALRESYIVKCEQMKFRYRDDCPWIFGGAENKEGVNFSVWSDSRIALVGPNGCGKTTLIQILDGKLNSTEGYVEQCRQVRVGRYSQHFVDQLPLEQNAVNYLIQCGVQTEFKARAKLGAFGLEGKAHLQEISTLSGGQKVRVAFAGISAAVPHVLLLDEPTNHLDMESIQALADSLNEFTGGVLVITHDARLIQTLEAELWVVENSNVVKFNGDLQDYREHLVEILGLEEERKALDAEKAKAERAAEKANNMDADERARLEAKKAARRNKEDSSKKAAEDAARAEQEGALAAFLDKPKKEKKEKKDKEEKKEKKEKKDKEDKKEKKEKKEKKDKKEK